MLLDRLVAARALLSPFNSLFEMPEMKLMAESAFDTENAFNSLFEMLHNLHTLQSVDAKDFQFSI